MTCLRLLEREIALAPKPESIQIKTGPSDEEIRRQINDCSFFVTASEYEGFGQTTVEAMSAGLLPIVNDIKSLSTIVKRSPVGLIIDFKKPKQAAREILKFMSMSRSDFDMKRSSAIAEAQQYSWDLASKRFVSEYERALGGGSRSILGVRFASLSREEAVRKIDDAFEAGEKLSVAFANAHTLNVAKADESFRKALSNFMVLNDGVGVDIASRIKFGSPFQENMNGTDFVPFYLASTRHSLRIFLIGSNSDVAFAAAKEMVRRFPRHRIVGFRDGFFADHADVVSTCCAVKNVDSDLILVGMGNPKQELWI